MNNLFYIFLWIFLGAAAAVTFLKYFRRWKIKKRIFKARKLERKAVELLKKNGFEVVELQKESHYTLFIDGKPYKAAVKADMIVKKHNKIYVAEVKSGDRSPSPRFIDTRRQLLEYYLVYRPKGLLLVDMEKEKIRKVEYSMLNSGYPSWLDYVGWPAIILFVGFIIGFLTRGV
ncbi:MAG TPA: hypothetical protein GXX35_07650 [Thermoanaerobacterales bacterium]|nr:hypothetical protein [Thermoanaerobacterales bacterium]